MNMRCLLVVMSMIAFGACGSVFAAVAKPVIVPAPQKMKVNDGSFSVKAKEVDLSLYAFEKDASLPKKGMLFL